MNTTQKTIIDIMECDRDAALDSISYGPEDIKNSVKAGRALFALLQAANDMADNDSIDNIAAMRRRMGEASFTEFSTPILTASSP